MIRLPNILPMVERLTDSYACGKLVIDAWGVTGFVLWVAEVGHPIEFAFARGASDVLVDALRPQLEDTIAKVLEGSYRAA